MVRTHSALHGPQFSRSHVLRESLVGTAGVSRAQAAYHVEPHRAAPQLPAASIYAPHAFMSLAV
eukprot:15457797-Alexandrium_andersonii.AAC.1